MKTETSHELPQCGYDFSGFTKEELIMRLSNLYYHLGTHMHADAVRIIKDEINK